MILSIPEVITAEEQAALLRFAHAAPPLAGGPMPGRVPLDAGALNEVARIVMGALRRQARFIDTVQPRALAGLMVSQLGAGHPGHELPEPALMGEGTLLRPDVTFVLFLSEPAAYQGGALSLGEMMSAAPSPARSLVCLPSAWRHQVGPVTGGRRTTVVGWLQSLVRDAQVRELLHDLAEARNAVHSAEGNSRAFELLNKSYANLLRRYAET